MTMYVGYFSLFRTSKAQEEVWIWRETNIIAGAHSLYLAVSF